MAFLEQVRAQVSPDVQHYTFENPHTYEPQPDGGWDVARFTETRAHAVTLLRRLLDAGAGSTPRH